MYPMLCLKTYTFHTRVLHKFKKRTFLRSGKFPPSRYRSLFANELPVGNAGDFGASTTSIYRSSADGIFSNPYSARYLNLSNESSPDSKPAAPADNYAMRSWNTFFGGIGQISFAAEVQFFFHLSEATVDV